LQGIDAGDKTFEEMLPEYWLFLEWLTANRINELVWILLEIVRDHEFSRSLERQQRLAQLVSMAHEWDLKVGIDAPLMMTQQHSFSLTKGATGTREERLDKTALWLVETGINFLQTQQGTTEFDDPDDQVTIDLLDHLGQFCVERNMTLHVKVHCPQKKISRTHLDPRTGKKINQNFLTHFCTENVGALAHTVQVCPTEFVLTVLIWLTELVLTVLVFLTGLVLTVLLCLPALVLILY
jgi:hypothetical protein